MTSCNGFSRVLEQLLYVFEFDGFVYEWVCHILENRFQSLHR